MKPILLTFCILLLYTLPATAQVADSTNRWFFENANYLIQPRLLTGEAFTKGRIGFGNITRVLYRVPVGNHLRLSSGLGVVVQQIRQRSELDRFLCETNAQDCQRLAPDHVIANHTGFNLEVPLQVRAYFSGLDRGVYLLGAAAVQVPVFRDLDVYAVDANNNERFIADGTVDTRTTAYWSTGLGYQVRYSDRFAWYLEIVASWSMGAVLDDTGFRDELGLPNYFRSVGVRQLGLTGGLNF